METQVVAREVDSLRERVIAQEERCHECRMERRSVEQRLFEKIDSITWRLNAVLVAAVGSLGSALLAVLLRR